MLARLVPLVIVALALAAAPARADTRTFEEGGVAFTYDASLASGVALARVAAVPLENPDDKPDGVAPAHLLLTLRAPDGSKRPAAQLVVMPTRDTADPHFAARFPTVDAAARALAALLRDRPADLTKARATPRAEDQLPWLPWADVAQSFRARAAVVEFASGSGLALVTQIGIEPTEITSGDVVFAFQGLTRDGAAYVALEVPLTAPGLPPVATGRPWQEVEASFGADCARIATALDAAPAAAFAPDLDRVLALVRSLRIAPDALSHPGAPR